jgi:hypothetical protein
MHLFGEFVKVGLCANRGVAASGLHRHNTHLQKQWKRFTTPTRI